MRNRLAAFALAILFLTSVNLPFSNRLSAQNQEPIPFQMLFTEVPPPGTPLSLGAFAPLANPIQVADHTFGISMEGEIDLFDPRTGSMRLHLMPYGAAFPIDFSMGFYGATPGVTTPNVLITGPSRPSTRGFQAYLLQPAPMLVGEMPDPWTPSGGFRVDIADVDADSIAEVIHSAGPGGGGHVRVLALTSGLSLQVFDPFGPGFNGGVSIATGDVTGDGKAEILAGQETGGEFRVFDVVGNQVRLRAIGHPFGSAFTGGVRVAAGDMDGDGRADIITAPAQGEPRIRVFCLNGPTPVAPIADFLAFDPTLRDGVFVDTGISSGYPLIIATTGNRYAQFEARANDGVRPIEALLEELSANQPYRNIPMTVNAAGAIPGQIRTTPLKK